MHKPNRQPIQLENAEIEWLDSGQPFASRYGDVYFSRAGGQAESRHVFIDGNDLATRFARLKDEHDRFSIAELGFGTGLNLLLAWDLWLRLACESARLHYLAFELHPLKHEDLRRALSAHVELAPLAARLLSVYIDPTPGLHRIELDRQVTLDLYLGDALSGLLALDNAAGSEIDCWFLDGFSPSKNPALWEQRLFARMASHSRVGTTLSTYSVAGQVRRNLQGIGFTLECRDGFGNKRQMLCGRLESKPDAPVRPKTAWHHVPPRHYESRTAIVVGAGMAGCSTAYSLARRGWQIQLLDQGEAIAGGASGNLQGILQPRLAADTDTSSRFYLQSLLYASRHYTHLQTEVDCGWHQCGVLLVPRAERRGLMRLLEDPQAYYNPDVLRAIPAMQSQDIADLTVRDAALWIPAGGWLRPPDLCRAWLDGGDGNIELHTNSQVSELQRHADGWKAITSNGSEICAEVVIIANGPGAAQFEQTSTLPLSTVRGQVTLCPATPVSSQLSCVVVGERYLCPAADGWHSVGASFQADRVDRKTDEGDDENNLSGLVGLFEQWPELTAAPDRSRASLRCNSIDYRPMVGAVPDRAGFINQFGALARDASIQIERPGAYYPGLYINAGHGSYGLTTSPIAGELLGAMIAGERPPLTDAMVRLLSPARFIIRELKRQKIDRLSD